VLDASEDEDPVDAGRAEEPSFHHANAPAAITATTTTPQTQAHQRVEPPPSESIGSTLGTGCA
jgi:hypothetical protein